MNLRTLIVGIILSLSMTIYSQEDSNELSAKEKYENYVKGAKVKIAELDEQISEKDKELESAKTSGDESKVEILSSELKDLKTQRRKLKKSTQKVITVAMPLVGKNAMMGFFAGAAGTFVYNLDVNRQSPYSITSAYVNKSLENSGILFGITNNQFIAKNKWRFSEQYIHYEYEMPLSIVNIGDFDLF